MKNDSNLYEVFYNGQWNNVTENVYWSMVNNNHYGRVNGKEEYNLSPNHPSTPEPENLNKPLSEYTALEIAIYACNAGNSEERIEEVERMIRAYSDNQNQQLKEEIEGYENTSTEGLG